MSYLVATKNEFTIQLVNTLTPLIYDGLNSIYKEALKVSKSNEILKMFQSFLKRIPKWSNDMIIDEKKRILTNIEYPEDVLNLIKATIKSNIAILTFSYKSNNKNIDPKYYKNVDMADFIHRIYIECARDIWNNPYLFYHIYEPIDLKRNQRDCFDLIKNGIREAIRKMLPRRFILETYLNEDLYDKTDSNFEKKITEQEGKVVNKLVQQQLYNGFYDDKKTNSNLQKGGGDTDTSSIETRSLNDSLRGSNKNSLPYEKSEKSVGSKILSIIDRSKLTKNRIDLNSSAIPLNLEGGNNISERVKELTPIKNLQKNTNVEMNEVKSLNSNISNIDSRIKDILNRDLGESDLDETSVYSLEKDPSNYQEVFSNSVKETNNIVNSTDRRKNLEKNQFFANYLRV